MEDEVTEKDRFARLEAWENEALEEFFKYARSETELRQSIAFLIEHRELIRDMEVEQLEEESGRLLHKLQDLTNRQLLEEIQCFKDVLALQKKLLKVNGAPRD